MKVAYERKVNYEVLAKVKRAAYYTYYRPLAIS